jgi:hypothetical protein
MRRQRPIRGETREKLSACFMVKLRRAVRAEAARFDVSESFVVCVAVAYALGVTGQEQLTEPTTRKRKHHARKTKPLKSPLILRMVSKV